MGKLLGIGIKKYSGSPVSLLEKTVVSIESGLPGDHRGKSVKRQVTVLSKEKWESVCSVLGKNLPWTYRRANLFIEGIELEESKGKYLKISDLWLEINGEAKPCYRMDKIYPGLQKTLESSWRGGVTCRVIHAGQIKQGDDIEISQSLPFSLGLTKNNNK